MFTTSKADDDVLRSYELGANCYISKPVGLERFLEVIGATNRSGFSLVRLPPS